MKNDVWLDKSEVPKVHDCESGVLVEANTKETCYFLPLFSNFPFNGPWRIVEITVENIMALVYDLNNKGNYVPWPTGAILRSNSRSYAVQNMVPSPRGIILRSNSRSYASTKHGAFT
jgi:hypothetical protein